MSFRDSNGMRRVAPIVTLDRRKKEKKSAETIAIWGMTYAAGILCGLVLGLILWGCPR